jgi:hypothetical protein
MRPADRRGMTRTPNTYDIGDAPVLRGRYTDEDGAPANPTAATCKVALPDGTTATLTPQNTGTIGEYEATFPITISGKHWYRFGGTGVVTCQGEWVFNVRRRQVP